ncbi:MAG: 2Fe-2S iron-sulfur cluster-binding protein [Dehalococcoidia bacterium]
MPNLTIVPLNLTLAAEEGATIMAAAWSADGYWPTTCGGQGICTSCACSVKNGAENLDPLGRSERKTLAEEFSEGAIHQQQLRLACQARVRGDVTITKRGVRPARPSALALD